MGYLIFRAIVFALLLVSVSGYSQNIEQLKKDIAYLASDELEGREAGTEGAYKAGKYLKARFVEEGLKPHRGGDYFQEFYVIPAKNPHEMAKLGEASDSALTVRNVVGFLDNGAKMTVVIGAHFDHLGYGGVNSLFREGEAVHNGADDNASGTAALMQIAQMLKGKNKNNNYLFIAFTGEEKGLWGSNYFCKNPLIDLNTVNYMINMDMIGRLNEEKALAINGTGTSPLWEEAFQWTGSKELKLIKKKSGIGPSDHTSFYMKDIPVLHFFTGQHADYHKPADDADKINYSGILEVADFIVAIINALDKHGELPFTKTKNEEGDTPRFTVTLGVVPDYLYAEEGMRIDGVSDGKPAMKAGIISGDVVVQMGAMEVKDMMGYMKALAVFKKGDKTMVKVKRKNEVLEFEVEF